MEISSIKEQITDYISSLSEREKKVVLIGIPLILLFLYVVAVIVPVENLKSSYEKRKALIEKKFKKLEPQVRELVCLKKELAPVERKLKKGENLDAPSFVRTVARMVGLKVKEVKVLPGEEKNGCQKEIISVSFKEVELNRLIRFILKLENGSYYFRADGISISDYDENGLVSGKVTLFFYRRSSED